jgi:hypothetical protein
MKKLLPDVSVAQWLALTASVIALALVTIVPMWEGATRFDSKTAFDWMTFVAVVWATAFAADNLAEMQRTRISEFEPLLDIDIAERREHHKSHIYLTVRNLGKGTAVGLRITAFVEDPDQVEWIPRELNSITNVLKPGDSSEATVPLSPYFLLLNKDAKAHIIVKLSHRDPFGREKADERVFVMSDGYPARFHRVDTTVTFQRGAKQKLLQKYLDGLSETRNLGALGIGLIGFVEGDDMTVTIRDSEGPVWTTHRRSSQSVWDVIADVENRLQIPLRGVEPTEILGRLGPMVMGDESGVVQTND